MASLPTKVDDLSKLSLEKSVVNFWSSFPCPPPWNEDLLTKVDMACVSPPIDHRIRQFLVSRCQFETSRDEAWGSACRTTCKLLVSVLSVMFFIAVLTIGFIVWRKRTKRMKRKVKSDDYGEVEGEGEHTTSTTLEVHCPCTLTDLHYACSNAFNRARPLPACPTDDERDVLSRLLQSYVQNAKNSETASKPPFTEVSGVKVDDPRLKINGRHSWCPMALCNDGDIRKSAVICHHYEYISDVDVVSHLSGYNYTLCSCSECPTRRNSCEVLPDMACSTLSNDSNMPSNLKLRCCRNGVSTCNFLQPFSFGEKCITSSCAISDWICRHHQVYYECNNTCQPNRSCAPGSGNTFHHNTCSILDKDWSNRLVVATRYRKQNDGTLTCSQVSGRGLHHSSSVVRHGSDSKINSGLTRRLNNTVGDVINQMESRPHVLSDGDVWLADCTSTNQHPPFLSGPSLSRRFGLQRQLVPDNDDVSIMCHLAGREPHADRFDRLTGGAAHPPPSLRFENALSDSMSNHRYSYPDIFSGNASADY